MMDTIDTDALTGEEATTTTTTGTKIATMMVMMPGRIKIHVMKASIEGSSGRDGDGYIYIIYNGSKQILIYSSILEYKVINEDLDLPPRQKVLHYQSLMLLSQIYIRKELILPLNLLLHLMLMLEVIYTLYLLLESDLTLEPYYYTGLRPT